MYQAVIVDDEPYTVKDLVHAIDWGGFQLEIGCAATDPVKALDYILANPVSIVITDIAMPKLDGLELIKRIKQAKPYIYVVVLSAYDNFEYARTALRYGAENYLLKPIDTNELSDTISQIAGHIQMREQLNSTYGQAMMTFRNAFTEQWARNLLSNSEFITKARLLGINLEAPAFTVIIFTCSRGTSDMMSKFFDLLLHHLPGQFTGNFFFETPTRLAGVLSPSSDEGMEIADFVKHLVRESMTGGMRIFASAGCTVTHYSDVYQSYSQASLHTWLEHTKLLCYFYQQKSGLEEQARAALRQYEKNPAGEAAAVRKLFDKYSGFSCMICLLTLRMNSLCSEEFRLSEDFNNMRQMLSGLPGPGDDGRMLSFTMEFLHFSDMLLEKIRQAMSPCVDTVIKMMHHFDDRDISLKTLAAKLNVSSSYLGTIFHQQTGSYFNDYLAEIRLKKAAELLENTNLKIKDIVEKTGFSSQPYFTRSFKRYYNTSPANYRRERSIDKL